MQRDVDQYLRDFDTNKEQHEKRIAELTAATDDDGWITVTRQHGRKKTEGQGGVKMGASSMSTVDLKRMAAKAKEKEKADFYRFQKNVNREKCTPYFFCRTRLT